MKIIARQTLIVILTVVALVALAPAMALDANAQSSQGDQSQQSNNPSMDDVARMIRQKKRWQILEATPQQDGSGLRYRFKVINKTGKIKVITIDPRQPNLRRLEQ